jgi:hypothetical protein
MSWMYDDYLNEHRAAVRKAYDWLVENMRDELDDDALTTCGLNIRTHDASKNDVEEYGPYDEYFYGRNKSAAVKANFNKAWLHHIHHNPHHWQHWVLLEDDGGAYDHVCIEMPLEYVYEMICDWWSFSWRSGNLMEIFDWYEKHKNMKLHPKTLEVVVSILGHMRNLLESMVEEDAFALNLEKIRKERAELEQE